MSDASSAEVLTSVDGEIQLEEVAAAERSQHGSVASPGKRKAVLNVLTWVRIVVLPLAGIVYWVGLWNLLDQYVLEDFSIANGFWYRDGVYFAVGMAGNLLLRRLWKAPQSSSVLVWKELLLQFLRTWASVTLSIVFWTGAWNFFDIALMAATMRREVVYVFAALPVIFVLEVLCSGKAMRHWLQLPDYRPLDDEEGKVFTVWT